MDEETYIDKMAQLYQTAVLHMSGDKNPLDWEHHAPEFKEYSRRVMRKFLLLSAAFSQEIASEVQQTIDKKAVLFAMTQANKTLSCMSCGEGTYYRLIRKSDNSIWPFCEKHIKEGLKNLVEMSP